MSSLGRFLAQHGVETNLITLAECIAKTSERVSKIFANTPVSLSGSANVYGDQQLSVDIVADESIFEELENSHLVAFAASEENPAGKFFHQQETNAPLLPFQVYFDPLDGSSIADCNWSIGSIYSVYPSAYSRLQGLTGAQQVLAAVVVYGPRTTIIFGVSNPKLVFELTLIKDQWVITCPSFSIANEAKIFSPANLRSANDLVGYKRIIDDWIAQRLTLRYTGGMVPDVVGMLIKGNGIFASPVSEKARAKLRLVFEVAPIALIVTLAGGLALVPSPPTDPPQQTPRSILDVPIETINDRIGIICGSTNNVLDCFRSIYQLPVNV